MLDKNRVDLAKAPNVRQQEGPPSDGAADGAAEIAAGGLAGSKKPSSIRRGRTRSSATGARDVESTPSL